MSTNDVLCTGREGGMSAQIVYLGPEKRIAFADCKSEGELSKNGTARLHSSHAPY